MSSSDFFREKGLNVSCETFDHLKVYYNTLVRWQKPYNLISDSTLPYIWERHFLDSAQLVSYIPSSTQTIIDLGSGAGFPGVVIALLTNIKTLLIESSHKKSFFLKELRRITNAPVEVISDRIENLPSLQGDVGPANAPPASCRWRPSVDRTDRPVRRARAVSWEIPVAGAGVQRHATLAVP